MFVLKAITYSLFFIGIICLFLVTGYVILDPKVDTTGISNIGFLILVALSNCCFTWSRSLTEESVTRFSKSLNRDGAACVMAALSYAVGSLTKYIYINSFKFHIEILNNPVNKALLFVFCLMAIVTAFTITSGICWSLVITYRKIQDIALNEVIALPQSSHNDTRTR